MHWDMISRPCGFFWRQGYLLASVGCLVVKWCCNVWLTVNSTPQLLLRLHVVHYEAHPDTPESKSVHHLLWYASMAMCNMLNTAVCTMFQSLVFAPASTIDRIMVSFDIAHIGIWGLVLLTSC